MESAREISHFRLGFDFSTLADTRLVLAVFKKAT